MSVLVTDTGFTVDDWTHGHCEDGAANDCRAVDLAAADPVHWESKQADQVLRIFARLAPGLQLCGNQPLRRVHCPAD